MPGPWQAVGNVLPTSRVMVLTEIQLDAEPLPQLIFSGEILKVKAELTNGGEPIQYKEFKDIIELKINFASTNNPNFNNFGTPTSEVARFYDDGRGMDERPMDGTFTGQFNLTIPSGEWRPTYIVETPLYTRELVLDNLLLMPSPVEIKINIDSTGETYHEMLIDAVREHVDIESLLVDGTVKFPNGETRHFSMTEPSTEARRYEIVSVDYGIYRVKITAYGKTVFGRDFILNVPEYTFTVDDPALSFDLAEDQTVNTIDNTESVDGTTDDASDGINSGDSAAGENAINDEDAESADPVDLELAQMEKRLAALGDEEEATFADDELDPDLNPESGMSTATLVIIIIVANLIVIVGGGLFLKRIILGPTPKKPKKKKVKIEITDQGPGINLDDKDKLFLPDFSTKKRGTGLGLAIVSQVIAEHHGSIDVENAESGGAKFIIQIPA